MKGVFTYRILKNRTVSVSMGIISATIVFLVAFLFSFKNSYDSYWQAIFRVQTVDFNMISHVFPPLLRNYIIENDSEALQQLIDSNFSAFKIAVDVCVDSQCSNYRELAVNGGRFSGELLEVPIFRGDKAPAAVGFKHSYSKEPFVAASGGQELLGRLRLYRVEPPALAREFSLFIERLWSGKAYASRYIAYFANLCTSLFLSISFFLSFVLIRNYYLEKRLRASIAMLLRKGVLKSHA